MPRSLTKKQARSLAARRKTHGAGPGRPKGSLSNKKRCPCGEATMKRAKSRGFDCCRSKGALSFERAMILAGKRCYCRKMTMKRAKSRDFDCCRKAILVWSFIPEGLVIGCEHISTMD